MRWLDGNTDSMDMSLRKLQKTGKDREARRSAVDVVTKSQTRLSECTVKITLNWRLASTRFQLNSMQPLNICVNFDKIC